MEHKIFRINAIITAFISAVAAALYIYCSDVKPYGIKVHISVKTVPLISMICLNGLYMCVYKVSTYSSLTLVSLFLSLIGDILLAVSDDSLKSMDFLIGGGLSFLIARIIWNITFCLDRRKLIHYDPIKCGIVLGINLIIYLGIGVALFINNISMLSGLILGYVLIGMPVQTTAAFLRIGKIEHESVFSTSFAFIGMVIFNISDILLFFSMELSLPQYVMFISNVLYWIGMYLLTISIVRTSSEVDEVSTFYDYQIV